MDSQSSRKTKVSLHQKDHNLVTHDSAEVLVNKDDCPVLPITYEKWQLNESSHSQLVVETQSRQWQQQREAVNFSFPEREGINAMFTCLPSQPSYTEAVQVAPLPECFKPPTLSWILPFPTPDNNYQPPQSLVDSASEDVGTIRPPSFDVTQSPHQFECQICFNGSVECVLLPCGHARYCQSCANHLKQQSCPNCRQPVSSVHRIYL